VIVCETETLLIDENWLSLNTLKTPPLNRPLSEELVAREKERIETALAETRGRVAGPLGAAGKLRIPRSPLDSKIRSLKFNTERVKTGESLPFWRNSRRISARQWFDRVSESFHNSIKYLLGRCSLRPLPETKSP